MRFRRTTLAAAFSVVSLAMGASGAHAVNCHELVADNVYVCTTVREGEAPSEIAVSFDAAGEVATFGGAPLVCTCSSTGRSIPRLELEAGRQITCTTLGGGSFLTFTAKATNRTLSDGTLTNISVDTAERVALMKCALFEF